MDRVNLRFVAKSVAGTCPVYKINFKKKTIELFDGDIYKFEDIESIGYSDSIIKEKFSLKLNLLPLPKSIADTSGDE